MRHEKRSMWRDFNTGMKSMKSVTWPNMARSARLLIAPASSSPRATCGRAPVFGLSQYRASSMAILIDEVTTSAIVCPLNRSRVLPRFVAWVSRKKPLSGHDSPIGINDTTANLATWSRASAATAVIASPRSGVCTLFQPALLGRARFRLHSGLCLRGTVGVTDAVVVTEPVARAGPSARPRQSRGCVPCTCTVWTRRFPPRPSPPAPTRCAAERRVRPRTSLPVRPSIPCCGWSFLTGVRRSVPSG